MSEMTILVKEPHKAWQKREIDGSLESMQELVGGYIEVVPYGNAIVICNEEGLLQGLEENKALGSKWAGTIFLCGKKSEELVSVPWVYVDVLEGRE